MALMKHFVCIKIIVNKRDDDKHRRKSLITWRKSVPYTRPPVAKARTDIMAPEAVHRYVSRLFTWFGDAFLFLLFF